MWIKNIKNNKAFTLIEFIIVMAIIGILVLLASPKFLDYVNKAKLTQIINDSKVSENYTTTHKAMYDNLPKGKIINEDELTELVKNKTLYFEGKIIKNLDSFNTDDLYLLDKNHLVKEVNTKLKGDFIYTEKGIIYINNINYKNKDDIDIEDLEDIIGPVKQVALGYGHSAAITENGDLYTWGAGGSGRLGHGDEKNKNIPTKVKDLTNVKQVALGQDHSAAITEDGSLYTWGANRYGQLGHENKDSTNIPTEIKYFKNESLKVKHISLGSNHSAAITQDGSLYTWGNNTNGQLGHNDKVNKNTPIKIEYFKDYSVKEIALGEYHSAAITEDGSLYTWGGSMLGVLGHKDEINKSIPTKIKDISNVKQVALGRTHSSAITENGTLYTWGWGSNGQLGHGNNEDKNIPTEVEYFKNETLKVKHISLGSNHSAAITEDGSLYTWGNNEYNKLGYKNTIDNLKPKKVYNVVNIKQIILGDVHTSIITDNGNLYTWGSGANGRLGHGDTDNKDTPTKVELFNKE